jgi:hypothetical protein
MDFPKQILKAKQLYIDYDGRVFCTKTRCAGMSALFTGKDIHGRKVLPVNPSCGSAG